MNSVDVCIVGGGIAGASVACQLAGRASVLLLEAERQVGLHTTGRSAAMYMPFYGGPVVRALTVASDAFFRGPPEGFSATQILAERGALTIASPDQVDHIERELAASDPEGVRLLRWSGAQARERVPSLRAGHVAAALYDPSAMEIDVEALLQGYLRATRRAGGEIATGEEVASLERRGRHWRIRTGTREIDAEVVVDAAGAWADVVAARAGVAPLGVVPCRRTAFTFDGPAEVDLAHWPMVIDAEERFYFKPDAGRLLGSLAEETPEPPRDAYPDDVDVATAVERIEGAVDFEIRRVHRSWAGQRVFVADRTPVSGFDPDAPGFYWHAALGGYGIQTSAALGAFAAGMILEGRPPDHVTAAQVDAASLGVARLRGGRFT